MMGPTGEPVEIAAVQKKLPNKLVSEATNPTIQYLHVNSKSSSQNMITPINWVTNAMKKKEANVKSEAVTFRSVVAYF